MGYEDTNLNCCGNEAGKESEALLQKTVKFKVVNTPIKPKKYLN